MRTTATFCFLFCSIYSFCQDWKQAAPLNTSGFISLMAFYDGQLYIGGQFDSINNVPAKNIAKWDGTKWTAVGIGSEEMPSAMEVFKGDLYITGKFDFGNDNYDKIAKWDGEKLTRPGKGINSKLSMDAVTLTVYKDKLFIGGWFDSAGGMKANNLAEWDGQNWSNSINGMDGEITSFIQYNDSLYAIGSFKAGNKNVPIAILKDSNWYSIGNYIHGRIRASIVFNNKLFLAGSFDSINDEKCNSIIYMDKESWWDASKGLDTTFIYDINTFGIYDNQLYAGLCPTYVYDSLPTKFIYEWNGKSWKPIKNDPSGVIFDMLNYNGEFYICGGFDFYSDKKRVHQIAKWISPYHGQ